MSAEEDNPPNNAEEVTEGPSEEVTETEAVTEDAPKEEVVEEPCKEVIIKKKMITDACQPNNMGGEQNAVVQPLLTGLSHPFMTTSYAQRS